jgi:hypothetical protein
MAPSRLTYKETLLSYEGWMGQSSTFTKPGLLMALPSYLRDVIYVRGLDLLINNP